MSQEWYYNRDDDRIGPVSEAELRSLIADGTVTRDTPVWSSDLPSWQPAGQLESLFAKSSLPRPTPRRRYDDEDDRPRRRYDDEDDFDDEEDDRPARRRPGEQGGGFAVASLVLGLLGVPMSCLCGFLSFPLGIMAIIFGVLGRKSHNRGLAIAGIVLGALDIAVAIAAIIISLALQAGNW